MLIFYITVSTFLVFVAGQNVDGSIEEDEECVPMTNCQNHTDGADILRFRQFLDWSEIENNNCDNYLEKRCPKNMITDDDKNKSNVTFFDCGLRNPNGIEFTLRNQGLESEFGEFPWMIEISVKHFYAKTGLVYVAGGSLIHPSVVLTAAHKVYDKHPSELNVRAGEWDRNNEFESFEHQDRNVTKIIIHEGFSNTTAANGIALLILEKEFEFGENIQTVCLPKQKSHFDSSSCFVSGWGIKADTKRKANVLKKIDLSIVAFRECQRKLRETELGENFGLHQSFICAGGMEGKDACVGDGGSPLVCRHPTNADQYYQVGIVASGMGCGIKDIPAMYISTQKFRDWIDEKLSEEINDINYMDPKIFYE